MGRRPSSHLICRVGQEDTGPSWSSQITLWSLFGKSLPNLTQKLLSWSQNLPKCYILVGNLQCILQNCSSICVQNMGSKRLVKNSITFFPFASYESLPCTFSFVISLFLFSMFPAYMYVCLVGPQRTIEGVVVPGTWVRDGCECHIGSGNWVPVLVKSNKCP